MVHGDAGTWRRSAAVAAVVGCLGVWGPATAGTPATEGPATATARSGPILSYTVDARPHVSRRVPPQVRERLETAFDEAERRVVAIADCEALFHPLDLPALTALDFSVYYPASPLEEATVCRRAVAFARVIGGPIHLCRRFAWLSDEQAASAVLHEALHRAGLGECHTDPNGLLPMEVHAMVREACGVRALANPPLLQRAAVTAEGAEPE